MAKDDLKFYNTITIKHGYPFTPVLVDIYNTCEFCFKVSPYRDRSVYYHIQEGKILRYKDHIEISNPSMILEHLYQYCKNLNYSYSSVFYLKNEITDSMWNKVLPEPGLYFFLFCQTKLIPYDPEPLVHYGPELKDDCKQYTCVFYDIPNMNNNRFGMHIQDNRIDPVSFDFLYSDFLSIVGSIHTPKKFVDHFFLCCFKNQIPDGTEFTFFDKLDDFSVCRKLLPKKVKFNLKDGKIDVLEMLL